MRRAEVESLDAAARLTIDIEEEAGFDSRWSVRLECPDVVASHGFWSGADPGHLVEFFADLARNWRGWTGDRVFSTTEHDLGLRATHDGKGHVLLWVRLGPHVADIDKTWHVVAPLALEAGTLDRIAAQVRAAPSYLVATRPQNLTGGIRELASRPGRTATRQLRAIRPVQQRGQILQSSTPVRFADTPPDHGQISPVRGRIRGRSLRRRAMRDCKI